MSNPKQKLEKYSILTLFQFCGVIRTDYLFLRTGCSA